VRFDRMTIAIFYRLYNKSNRSRSLIMLNGVICTCSMLTLELLTSFNLFEIRVISLLSIALVLDGLALLFVFKRLPDSLSTTDQEAVRRKYALADELRIAQIDTLQSTRRKVEVAFKRVIGYILPFGILFPPASSQNSIEKTPSIRRKDVSLLCMVLVDLLATVFLVNFFYNFKSFEADPYSKVWLC
jgi:hypothetical protein